MNRFDPKLHTSVVSSMTQEMGNWLDENDVEHSIQPNLIRMKHIFHVRSREEAKLQYQTRGSQIIFEDAKERLQFELMFSEYITG